MPPEPLLFSATIFVFPTPQRAARSEICLLLILCRRSPGPVRVKDLDPAGQAELKVRNQQIGPERGSLRCYRC